MKLASMHPMFQFFNRLLRSLFTQFYLENPRSDIVVLAKSTLQSMLSQSCRVKIAGVIEIWKCLLECQDWSPSLFLSTNCSHCILWHAIFGEAFTMKGGNFAEHILVKCPPPKKNFDGQNGIWQALRTWILNAARSKWTTERKNPNFQRSGNGWQTGHQCMQIKNDLGETHWAQRKVL